MIRVLAILVVCLAIAAAAHAAGTPAVQRLLPAANAVKGFTILPDSLQYGKGNDISKIYDGGYELYTRNGVIDAARQMYQRGGDYVEVTIHTMKSAKAGLGFLRYWQKEQKAKSLTKSGASTGFLVTKPNVMAYFVQGKYLVTISAFHAADKAAKDAIAFRTVIGKAIPNR
jgi:hypothetical protein